MMNLKLLVQIMAFALPAFSAFYCLILLAVNSYLNRKDIFTNRLSYLLIFFYGLEIVHCITIALYFFNRKVSIYTAPVNLYCTLIIPIILYHIVFKLTRLRKEEYFSLWHYFIPFFFLILTSMGTVLASQDFLKSIFYDIDEKIRPYVRLAFSAFYIFLGIVRVLRYKRIIKEYSADIDASSLSWLYRIFWCIVIIFPVSFAHYFSISNILFDYLIIVIRFTLIIIFNSVLCCSILSKNFLLLTEDIIFRDASEGPDDATTNVIDPEVFEEFMKSEKPYLRHDLKITDMILPLGTNRTYLSNFINRYYGKNFSTFINSYRLSEIELLREDPYYKEFSEEELIYTVGFKSVKSYKRIKDIVGVTK